jgi:hypothetical protein
VEPFFFHEEGENWQKRFRRSWLGARLCQIEDHEKHVQGERQLFVTNVCAGG